MNETQEIISHLRLQLNIDHPSVEECYLDGYKMMQQNIEEDENPFAEGSEEHRSWQDGWWACFYGEKALFELPQTQAAQQVEAVAAPTQRISEMRLWFYRLAQIFSAFVFGFVMYQLADLAI